MADVNILHYVFACSTVTLKIQSYCLDFVLKLQFTLNSVYM